MAETALDVAAEAAEDLAARRFVESFERRFGVAVRLKGSGRTEEHTGDREPKDGELAGSGGFEEGRQLALRHVFGGVEVRRDEKDGDAGAGDGPAIRASQSSPGSIARSSK